MVQLQRVVETIGEEMRKASRDVALQILFDKKVDLKEPDKKVLRKLTMIKVIHIFDLKEKASTVGLLVGLFFQ